MSLINIGLLLTWAIPSMKAKGLRKLKVHSKDAGSCLYNAMKPRLPQKTVRRNTTSPVRKEFFIKTLIRKAKAIYDERRSSWFMFLQNYYLHNKIRNLIYKINYIIILCIKYKTTFCELYYKLVLQGTADQMVPFYRLMQMEQRRGICHTITCLETNT